MKGELRGGQGDIDGDVEDEGWKGRSSSVAVGLESEGGQGDLALDVRMRGGQGVN